jgi:flagellar M-ring protein FliF
MTMPSWADALITRVGGQQRAIMIAVGVAVAALIFGVSRWATAPEWVPAFTRQPVETVGQLTDKLQQAGIPFKLENGGSDILVNAKDVARARVTLAKDGLPVSGRPGLELFDQPSWGMTDFTQRVNYRRALEGELERTIGKMRGVQAAKVHLALHEQSNFRQQDKPANASVVLKTDGQTPPPDVVQGIAHLVASSVDGLESDRVTVLDDSGRLLSQPKGEGSLAALSTNQLALQREVESYLETKAEGLLTDIVGKGNARVRVTATLNFDKIERQSQLVDPEKQATSTEQRYEIIPGAEGGAASSNVAISYENSRVTESFSGAIGNISRLSVAVLVNDKQVLPVNAVGNTETTDGSEDSEESTQGSTAKAVYVARTPEEIAHIEALVKSAVGVDSTRGDVVTVVSTRFDNSSLIDDVTNVATPTVWDRMEQFHRPGIALLGFATGLIALLLVLRTLKGDKQGAPQLALANAGGGVAGILPSLDPTPAITTDTPVDESESSDQNQSFNFLDRKNLKGKVIATIAHKPDVSVRAVRAWMKEA